MNVRRLQACYPRRATPALFVLLALALLAACGGGKSDADKDENASVPVEIAIARHAPITASYAGTASVEAEHEADVVAKTSGVLLKLKTEEGQHVKRGQVLAQLDDARERLAVAQAGATLDKLKSDFHRAEEMKQRHLLSQKDFDQVRYDLATQRAVYDQARLELSYTRIEAPISGIVSRRMVKQGNLVQANTAMFHIVDMDPLIAVLPVPEREMNTLKVDQPVQMQVDALPGKSFKGAIERVAPVVDAGSGTFRVTCRFSDDAESLRPGMFGRIQIVYDTRRDALVIPRSALVEEDGETAVFVVAKGKPKPPQPPAKVTSGDAVAAEAPGSHAKTSLQARRIKVTLGYSDGDRVEIRDGLKSGDRVITTGRNAVRDGTEVQVLENPQ